MANRRFEKGPSNVEAFGKIIVEGTGSSDHFEVNLGFKPQYGNVSFCKSYTRNPFWFNDFDLNIFRLVQKSDNESFMIFGLDKFYSSPISAFSDAILFADRRVTTESENNKFDVSYSDSFCRVINKNSWSFINSCGYGFNTFDSVKLNFNLSIDKNFQFNEGYDLYLLVSPNESIFGDIFALIRGNGEESIGKMPFGGEDRFNHPLDFGVFYSDISEEFGVDERSMFSVGNLNRTTGDWANVIGTPQCSLVSIVEPIIFLGEEQKFKSPKEYDFWIEEDGKMFISFASSLSQEEVGQMTIVLVRADLPEIKMKIPGTFTENGFQVEHKNFSYQRMELNYKVF